MLNMPRRRIARPAEPAWEFLPAVLGMEEVTAIWVAFSTVDSITIA